MSNSENSDNESNSVYSVNLKDLVSKVKANTIKYGTGNYENTPAYKNNYIKNELSFFHPNPKRTPLVRKPFGTPFFRGVNVHPTVMPEYSSNKSKNSNNSKNSNKSKNSNNSKNSKNSKNSNNSNNSNKSKKSKSNNRQLTFSHSHSQNNKGVRTTRRNKS